MQVLYHSKHLKEMGQKESSYAADQHHAADHVGARPDLEGGSYFDILDLVSLLAAFFHEQEQHQEQQQGYVQAESSLLISVLRREPRSRRGSSRECGACDWQFQT
jgi:hypothetical protein